MVWCFRALTTKTRLRKAGLALLLVVCVTTGVFVWGGQSISRTDEREQLQNDGIQELRRTLGEDTQRGPQNEVAQKLSDVVSPTGNVRTESLSEVTVDHVDSLDPSCLKWCHRGNSAKPPYYLVAVLLVRIYYVDPAKLTTREMLQWLQYLRYAGVEHVYVYDAYVYKNESQIKALKPFLDDGYVTYVDWSSRAYPYSIQGTQVAAYQDCMDKWGKDSVWQVAIDIDEYPFSPSDTSENFLPRFLRKFSGVNRNAAEITMLNFLFLGKPLSEVEHPLIIDRMYRRTHRPANALVKPIYMPSRLSGAQVLFKYTSH